MKLSSRVLGISLIAGCTLFAVRPAAAAKFCQGLLTADLAACQANLKNCDLPPGDSCGLAFDTCEDQAQAMYQQCLRATPTEDSPDPDSISYRKELLKPAQPVFLRNFSTPKLVIDLRLY
jgi:hypothetical protein